MAFRWKFRTQWRKQMIDHGTLLSIPFLKKSRFTGSDRGMRYSIYKIEEENETFLEAAACPGPFSVDFTKPELFTKKRFSFDDEGRAAAVDWLNELYEEKREFFEDVYNHPDKYYKEHHKTDE